MTDKKTFEIFYLKKIPYLTNGLFVTFFLSAVLFGIFYGALNNDGTTPEMKTFYLINTSTIKLLYASAFVSGLSFIFYLIAKLKRNGVIIFLPDAFELILKNERVTLPVSNIRTIWCNDSEQADGQPNEKFTMTIDTWKNKKYWVRLRNSEDIRQFIDKLLQYDTIKIEYQYSRWTLLD